jgi:hypothetical protein
MGIRRNKTFVEQATEAVESAYESARENLAPVIAEAMEMAEGAYEEAKEKAAPMVAEARDKAVPLVAAGAAAAAKGAAAAADLAAQKAAEGRDLAAAKAAELETAGNGKKKHRLRTFILITGIAAALGFVVKKLTSGSGQDNWQSSYTPPPPPAAKASDTPIADAAAAASAEQGDDEGGASPDEAIADAVEEQHPVTTPDEPAEVVDLVPGEEAAEQSSRKP